ncbi:hypothetical protein M422DRAFT_275890 [Sphaerobolus stellatus SS14]|uniref:Uncharacterized protein n=1 Tax=Sphaerobolus stellatus (strain SS14) TaxID=990650 RepID=A0A0C9U370_SPHS4|nr:hypothetical protein M422DRAFT_275890 [Sphaerobolus stellatus SS14]
MSFTQIWGNFQLKDSWRQPPYPNQPSDVGYYLHYKANIHTNGGDILADIRVYQPVQERALPEGAMAFVFGKFYMSDRTRMQIEAIHIFHYHRSISAIMLGCFQPRVVISGYIFQETEELANGTKLIFVNGMGFVGEHYNVLAVVGAMVANKRWPVQPPTPKLYSPVQMTGFIDGIDSCNDLPIIAVEDITLEIGNKLVAEKINQARIELALIKYRLPVSQRPFHTDVEYDYTWAYAASRASLASVPSYDTSYPLPFPLQASPGFIYPIIKDIVHPCIRDMSFLKRSRSRLMVNVGRDTTSAIHPIVIEESPKAAAHSLGL